MEGHKIKEEKWNSRMSKGDKILGCFYYSRLFSHHNENQAVGLARLELFTIFSFFGSPQNCHIQLAQLKANYIFFSLSAKAVNYGNFTAFSGFEGTNYMQICFVNELIPAARANPFTKLLGQ